MEPYAKIINPDPVSGSITIFTDGKQFTIHASDARFVSALSAVNAEEWDTLYSILNPSLVV